MVHTAEEMAKAFADRYPAQPGTVDLAASEDVSSIADYSSIEDMQAVGVTSFVQATDSLVWVKITSDHGIRVAGTYVPPGDYVQLKKGDANLQVSLGRAAFATEAEVAEARKGPKAK